MPRKNMAARFAGQAIRHPRKLLSFVRKMRFAHRLYGKPYSQLLRRFYRLVRKELYSPREIFLWDLLGPEFADDELDRAISKNACVALQLRLNPASAVALTEDKSVFYGFCRAHGLPVPRLLAVIGSPLSWTGEGAVLPSDTDIAAYLDGLDATDIVIKPSLGVYAQGVRILSRRDGGWLDPAGRRLSSAEILGELRGDEEYRSFIVQERVFNHPEIAALTGTGYLQTVRLVTLMTDAAGPQAPFAVLRLIADGAAIDNFQQGQSGNLLADVCAETGKIRRINMIRSNSVGVVEVLRHPVSGADLAGFQLPYWQEVRALALQAAKAFLPLVTIGWDIAITPEGPLLIEGNAFWGPIHNLQRNMHIFRGEAQKLLDGGPEPLE